jgi:tetratricopeptide (TPR) repeat protein
LIWVLQGKYEEAIQLYHRIEKISPNRYATAANLGTAYELVGQNEKALKYIQKAVRLNPDSHNHSEWIHVNILKVKIKGAAFYTSDFLINTNFGEENEPKTNLSTKELHTLADALYFQLNERISFIKPKNKIVAQLFFDLGNIAMLSGDLNDAKQDFTKAKEYGFNMPIIEDRIKFCNRIGRVKRMAKKAKTKSSVAITNEKSNRNILYGITALIFGLLGVIYFVKSRQSK